MILRRKRKKKDEVEEKDKDSKGKNPPSPRLRRAREYEGSRWAAFILLMVLLAISLAFYLKGLGGFKGLERPVKGEVKEGGVGESKRGGWFESTYVVE